MLKENIKKGNGWYWFYGIAGILTLWLVIDHVAGFEYPQYFYDQNPNIDRYVGTNVVSLWADFSFFTYQTMLFYALWSIFLFLSHICKRKRLERFLTREATVTFILANYTVTSLLYTAFELSSGNPTFGLYANTNAAIHNLGTNLLAHYVFYITALISGVRIRTNGKLEKRHVLFFLTYLFVYYFIVKLTGKFAYPIEWYPYPIFDGKDIWDMFSLSGYQPWKGNLLLTAVVLALATAYVFLLKGISMMKHEEKRKNTIEKTDGYALITGATGGLGKAFVYALAKRNENLILTGRSEEKLSALQQELQKTYPLIEVVCFAADLTKEGDRNAFMEKIDNKNLKISRLVNVAGADIQKNFESYTQEKIAFQCRVNFEAAVSLCLFAIERRDERLEILNVSSVSGIYPMPYFAIYSATKGALTSFSVALREEMKDNNVAVTVILPGAMPTREDIKEQIKGQGLWGKLAVRSPQSVAETALKAVAKNKRKVIVGFWNKVMRISTAWIPSSWRLRFIARRWSKISKDAF